MVVQGEAVLAFWGAMALHCYRDAQLSRHDRVIWLLAIVFGKLVGAGAYYFLRYRPRPLDPAPPGLAA